MGLVDIGAEGNHVEIRIGFGDDAAFEASVTGTDLDLVAEQIMVDASGYGDLDFLQFAQTAVARQLAGPAEFEIAALLGSELSAKDLAIGFS